MSASTIVRYGPGSRRDRSRTRMPRSASASGPLTASSLRACNLEQLLQLHREHRVTRHAELALEVELHAGIGIAEHRLEVVARDLDRALRLAVVAARASGRIRRAVDRPLTAAIAGDLEAVDRVELASFVRVLLQALRDEVVEQILRVLGHRGHESIPPTGGVTAKRRQPTRLPPVSFRGRTTLSYAAVTASPRCRTRTPTRCPRSVAS